MITLPNYFLADLPGHAEISASMVREACQTLRRNRNHYLAERRTDDMVRLLCEVGESWRSENFPLRQIALRDGPGATGFSEAVIAEGLRVFFEQLTEENLHALLVQDLGHVKRLDEWVAIESEQVYGRQGLATGPELLVQVTSGNLPVPAMQSLVLGILVRAAQFLKCARGGALLPRLFAHSIYQLDPKLGACLEIAEWPGGSTDLEHALFEEADCLTVTGSDQTIETVRAKIPATVRFVGYGHRVSFAYLTREALSSFNAGKWIERVAHDVAAWDQLGCLSPHVIYAERNGRMSPEEVGATLAKALDAKEEVLPRGSLQPETAAHIASRRSFYEVRAVHLPETTQWASEGSTAWTVVYEADPQFQMSCLNRFVYVKPVDHLEEALQGVDRVRGQVSTVGLAATEPRATILATQLARWGVTRICPCGRMQSPPLPWRHDGRLSLSDLVLWSDLERIALH